MIVGCDVGPFISFRDAAIKGASVTVTKFKRPLSIALTDFQQYVRSQHDKVDAIDMKNTYCAVITAWLLCGTVIKAQTYCEVTTALAYSMKMPGISFVGVHTIERSSEPVECGSVNCNSYVYTGLTTMLERGNTYTLRITHTRDDDFFPTSRNNIRVWIDYNGNGTFDLADETAVSMDYEPVGASETSFTIPAHAKLGPTRMRITAKMSDDAGHADPTPCDNPPDPLGYHGEIEDYTAVVTGSTTSVADNALFSPLKVVPNPMMSETSVIIDGTNCGGVVSVHTLMGQEVFRQTVAGAQRLQVTRGTLSPGTYIVQYVQQSGTVQTVLLNVGQ